MGSNNLDAYLVQETHLAGDFKKHLTFDYYIIHHGPESQPLNEANKGVAIVLSQELVTAWKLNGKSKKCIKGGMSTGNTTRFLSINIKLRPTKEQPKNLHNLCLTSIYHPHSGYKNKDLDQFNADVSSFLSNILSQNNTTHIIGADINALIGIKPSFCSDDMMPSKHKSPLDVNPILKLLAPHGNPHKSRTGDEFSQHA
jgi:hypothetical protein